jgi:hypothetical protein
MYYIFMREDLQEKFILLSKIAKEKKYAQEYMGLLARRGDIGSIRIGKRWYTTWEWFEEFLENSQKKKTESVCEAQVVQLEKAEPEAIALVEKEAQPIKISAPIFFPKREPVCVAPKVENISTANSGTIRSEVKANGNSFGIRINKHQAPKAAPLLMQKRIEIKPASRVDIKRQRWSRSVSAVPKTMANQYASAGGRDMQRYAKNTDLPKNFLIQKKNENPLPYKEIKFRKNRDVFSPVFGVNEKMQSSFFPRFVFATGFVMMFLLIAVSGYFAYSDGTFKNGVVAGASDERNSGFSGISSGGEYFLSSTGDKIKESLSVSRVTVEAAREKTAKNASPDEAKAVLNIN